MHRINDMGYSLILIGVVLSGLVGLILLEPDFGTSMSRHRDRRGGDGLCGWTQLHGILGAVVCALPPSRFW
jgi:hypothetical protein